MGRDEWGEPQHSPRSFEDIIPPPSIPAKRRDKIVSPLIGEIIEGWDGIPRSGTSLTLQVFSLIVEKLFYPVIFLS